MNNLLFGVSAALLLSFSILANSCVYDNRDACYLDIRFSYAYNVKEADAFSSEVKDIELYVFDEDGMFLTAWQDKSMEFPLDYTMRLPSLEAGTYTFVAMGRNKSIDDSSLEFRCARLEPQLSRLGDLTVRLEAPDGVCSTEIAALYNGYCTVKLENRTQQVHVEMKKLTNRFRILLLPYVGDRLPAADEFDIRIESSATWLDYRGESFQDERVTFLPFLQETIASGTTDSPTVSSGILADLNTSRLLYEDRPALVVRSRSDGKELLRINLAWLLSLQGIAEHRSQWSNQEYLDRQDMYSLTFFVDGTLFITSSIVVNGWVISLSDVTLH